jgi:HD-GYP domain-containing protein (c-di-GMP phosphodiesterase class II)
VLLETPPAMSRSRLLVAGIAGAILLTRARRRRERRVAERVAAAALEAVLNAIEANDPETGAHVRRVASYALVLARAAKLSERELHSVERVALFHDIGKIHEALFDVVHDQDRLSPEERRLIAMHPQGGADVLSPLGFFYPDLPEGVLSHHERWDGTGYPRGLRGEAIPLQARIVAIADTFDVVTHGRRYRRERSLEEARRIIAQGRGTQFDPALVDLFLSPRVFATVRVAERALHSPRLKRGPSRGSRREQPPGVDVPDITFRWRSESLAPLSPVPRLRTPHESPRHHSHRPR